MKYTRGIKDPFKDGEVAYSIDPLTGDKLSAEQYHDRYPKQSEDRDGSSRFVKGPIPVAWINKAVGVSALPVGLGLWFQAGLCGKMSFKLQPARLAEIGISDRHTRNRQLRKLEEAKLVIIHRNGRKTPTIEILLP